LYEKFENNLLKDLELDKCVNCEAGLLSVSDICPQCGWPKNKPIEINKSEEEVADNIEINEEEIVDEIKNNPPTKELVEIKNKISCPTGIRLFGLFHMVFGVSMVCFGIIFASTVIFLVMSSGMGSLGDVGGAGMVNMMMLPGMNGVDASIMSSIDTIIGLNAIAGSPSASDIEMRISSADILDIDLMMEIIEEASVIALIEIVLGLFAFVVGRGLFKGKKWARPGIFVSSIISILLVVLFVENIDNLILLGIAAFNGMILYYMFKPKVREYFSQPSIKNANKSKSKNSKKNEIMS